MTRSLVVGPNGGASFGKGGGSYVALRIAQTLAQEPNSSVGLLSLWGASPESLAKSFGIVLPAGRVKSYSLFGGNQAREPSINPLVTPYAGAVAAQLLRLLQRTIQRFDPHLIVFNDDSPRIVSKFPPERQTLLYAHFPYACRLRYDIPDSYPSKSPLRRISEALVRPLMIRLFETDRASVTWLAANSSTTKRYMVSTFGKDVSVIYPPIDAARGNGVAKSDLVISIGAIQPNKRLMDIIMAMRLTTSKCKCLMFGHLRDQVYYKALIRRIGDLGLENKVRIIPDAPREVMLGFLRRSKVILHTSRFEPFGLSVVEGMAAGAVPVVYAGEDSGPWVDIVQKGEFGFGFRDETEMAAQITELIESSSKWASYSAVAMKRATFFSPRAFSDALLGLIEAN